jgi:hypothetical protein
MPIALSAPTVPVRDNYDLSVEGDEYIALADAAAVAKRSSRTVRRWTEVGRRDRGVLPAAYTVHGVRVRISDLIEYMQPVPTGADHSRHAPLTLPEAGSFDSKASHALAPFDQLADAVSRVVSAAPPLTDAQRERLAVILGGAR